MAVGKSFRYATGAPYGAFMPGTISDDIETSLRCVIDPELGVDIVELGMVRGIGIHGTAATIQIALTIAACPLRSQIEGDVVRKVTALPGIDTVDVQSTPWTCR